MVRPLTAPALFSNEATRARLRSEGAAPDNATPRRPAVSAINSRLSDKEVGLQPRNAATAAPSPGGGARRSPDHEPSADPTLLPARSGCPTPAPAAPKRPPARRQRLRSARAVPSPKVRAGQTPWWIKIGDAEGGLRRPPPRAAGSAGAWLRRLAGSLQDPRKIEAAQRAHRLSPARPAGGTRARHL